MTRKKSYRQLDQDRYNYLLLVALKDNKRFKELQQLNINHNNDYKLLKNIETHAKYLIEKWCKFDSFEKKGYNFSPCKKEIIKILNHSNQLRIL